MGFFKGGFFRLQDVTVTFFELVFFWSTFYRVDFIGSPGSSCLADVNKTGSSGSNPQSCPIDLKFLLHDHFSDYLIF